jgi:hypothetical protein
MSTLTIADEHLDNSGLAATSRVNAINNRSIEHLDAAISDDLLVFSNGDRSVMRPSVVSSCPAALCFFICALFFHASRYTRRCLESNYHLMECGMMKEAIAELCDVEVICARVKAGVLSTTVKQLSDLCS